MLARGCHGEKVVGPMRSWLRRGRQGWLMGCIVRRERMVAPRPLVGAPRPPRLHDVLRLNRRSAGILQRRPWLCRSRLWVVPKPPVGEAGCRGCMFGCASTAYGLRCGRLLCDSQCAWFCRPIRILCVSQCACGSRKRNCMIRILHAQYVHVVAHRTSSMATEGGMTQCAIRMLHAQGVCEMCILLRYSHSVCFAVCMRTAREAVCVALCMHMEFAKARTPHTSNMATVCGLKQCV